MPTRVHGQLCFTHIPSPSPSPLEPHQILEEIDADTAKVCGSNKGLNNLPINLKIHSPNVLPLTLIDLPGATKIAVGDQPEDIGDQIRDMLLSYISRPNCL